jgi:hypothetical protein
MLFFNLLILNSAFCQSSIKSWNDFITNYEDSDNDGELDNFKSLNPGDDSIFIDEIISFTDNDELYISEIILRSNPEIPLYFGNTIGDEFKFGDKIWIYITVSSAKEADGDPCEDFDVWQIVKYEKQEVTNDDNENNDYPETKASTSFGGWLIICIVPLIPLLIVIYFAVLRPYMDRRQSVPQFNSPVYSNTNQRAICPICYQNTNFIPQYQKWYCANCEEYL